MTAPTPNEPRKRRSLFSSIAHWWHVFIDAGKAWIDDRAMTLGSSLAYYTLFSLAPLLLFSIALAGFVFGDEHARTGIVRELRETLGPEVADSIEAILLNASASGATSATLFGLGILLFGASGVFVELRAALNLIWKVPTETTSGIIAFIRDRFLSLTAVFAMGFLLLVSLVLSSVLTIVGNYAPALSVWQTVNTFASLGLITLVFACIYRLLPDAVVLWSDVWGGAFTAALLFTLGKRLFALYLSQAGVKSMYGSAASVVVILLWVYYSSLILLYGAEISHAHAMRSRSEAGLPAESEPKPSA